MVEAISVTAAEQPISVRFHLTWQEYFAAERFLQHQRQRLPSEQLAGLALLILSGVLWAAIGARWFLALPAVAGAVFLASPLFRRAGLRRRWAREPLHREEHVISFTKSGIHYLLGGVASDLPWSYFQSWLESPAAFLLITGEDVFNLVPKRAFTGEEMIGRFRELAASKLKPVAAQT